MFAVLDKWKWKNFVLELKYKSTSQEKLIWNITESTMFIILDLYALQNNVFQYYL